MSLKNRYLIVISLVLTLFQVSDIVWAGDDNVVPPGMELRIVGQTSIVVPRDAEIQEKGGLIIIEGIDKYVARTLFEMKQQINDLKEQQELLNKEVELLKTEWAKEK